MVDEDSHSTDLSVYILASDQKTFLFFRAIFEQLSLQKLLIVI